MTDVLVERGERPVLHVLAKNAGAQFSDTGYAVLVKKADRDDILTEAVGSRRDIPARLLRDLLARAAEAVKTKLLALISPEHREQLMQVLSNISTTISGASKDNGYANAEKAIRSLQSAGRLSGTTIRDFAAAGQMPQVIVGIAVLSSSKTDLIAEILTGVRNDAVLVPCKAAALAWDAVEAILRNPPGDAADIPRGAGTGAKRLSAAVRSNGTKNAALPAGPCDRQVRSGDGLSLQ